MVTVIKQSTDWAELDIDRRHFETLGYAVRLEEDPTRPQPGLVIGPQAYRLVSLVEDQGRLIEEALKQGVELTPCPKELAITSSGSIQGDGDLLWGQIKAMLLGLFKRNRN